MFRKRWMRINLACYGSVHISSGGREVRISGNNLDTVRQPKLYFENSASDATVSICIICFWTRNPLQKSTSFS